MYRHIIFTEPVNVMDKYWVTISYSTIRWYHTENDRPSFHGLLCSTRSQQHTFQKDEGVWMHKHSVDRSGMWDTNWYCSTSWNIMKHHETSWNIMKHHETSWNIMKLKQKIQSLWYPNDSCHTKCNSHKLAQESSLLSYFQLTLRPAKLMMISAGINPQSSIRHN